MTEDMQDIDDLFTAEELLEVNKAMIHDELYNDEQGVNDDV